MDHIQELQERIEAMREELDLVAANGLQTQECYQISVELDHLIEEYMECKEAKERFFAHPQPQQHSELYLEHA